MSCCGPKYYCSAAGPVVVSPDAEGYYDVPDGGTSGWYRTYAEAEDVCPEPPVSMACLPDEVEVPGVVPVTLADLTGDLVGLFDFNSVLVPIDTPFDDGFGTAGVTGTTYVNDVNGWSWIASVGFLCTGCAADEIKVLISFGPVDPASFGGGCGVGTYSSVGENGWAGVGSGATICRPKAGPHVLAEKVCTVTYACPSFSGTFGVYTS